MEQEVDDMDVEDALVVVPALADILADDEEHPLPHVAWDNLYIAGLSARGEKCVCQQRLIYCSLHLELS